MRLKKFRLFISTFTVIFLILIFWNSFYSMGCFILFFPIIILSLISYSFIEIKIHDKSCFVSCYFIEKTFLSKIFSSRFFIIVIFLIMSIFMTISLSYSIIDYDNKVWIYLIFHIFFMSIIRL